MFYDIFAALCERNHTTPFKAAKEIGLDPSSPNQWKKKGLTPRADKLEMIAEYFNVSIDYLLEKDENKKASNGVSLDAEEAFIIRLYRSLNGAGKDKVKENVQDIASIARYQNKPETVRKNEKSMLIAALGGGVIEHQVNATDEELKEALTEDELFKLY